MTRELIAIHGSCHCRNIQYDLRWPKDEDIVPARQCGCTFCQKHKGAWTSHRDSELGITIADEAHVSKYKFGTKTAEFYVCSVCGITPFAVSEIDGSLYSVVNVNTFEDAGGLSFSNASTDFDAEDTGSRLERRKRNWIPSVTFHE